jgi:cell wall-associated NlpC family hydrolase
MRYEKLFKAKAALARAAALLIITIMPNMAAALPATGAAYATERYEVLVKGDNDAYVLAMQKALHDKGYLKQEPTGYFGTDTQKAVMKFQQDKRLTVDGKVGPQTLKLIMGKSYEPIPATRKVQSSINFDSLSSGDSGDEVSKLQAQLKVLGYYKYPTITGFFGPQTLDAVKRFQQVNGLPTTGIAAEKTLNLVYTKNAKKATATKAVTTLKLTKAQQFIEKAKAYTGKRYSRGGNGPNAFDCSGFTTYVLKKMKVTAPRTAYAQSLNSNWQKVEKDALQKGDLVFFDTREGNPPVGHVGIYLGGGKFIHSEPGTGVTISSLDTGHYAPIFKWGRRIF